MIRRESSVLAAGGHTTVTLWTSGTSLDGSAIRLRRQFCAMQMRFSPGKAGKAIRDERDGLQATLDGVRDALHELSRERATLCRTLHQCGLEVHTVGASGSNLVDSVQGLLTELATLQERVQAAGKFAGP